MNETRKYIMANLLAMIIMVFLTIEGNHDGFMLACASISGWFCYRTGWENHKEWEGLLKEWED